MGKQYLIDSNSVIDYLSGKLHVNGMTFMNQIINEIPTISVITKIEVLGYKTTNEATQLLESFIQDSIVVGLSEEIVDKTIEIRKMYNTKIPDSVIAATALVYNSILITRNLKDFQIIKGLECINPHAI
ncbi:MAG: PilT protein domain-containing [Prolixibacteraceae bacterium]|nr:MAG: PilT protein domain-containing [Prolixibacteraceae bacterium]